MRPRRNRLRLVWLLFILLAACLVCGAGGYAIFARGRPAPVPVKRQLYPGVTYRREVHIMPHAMLVHLIIVDKRESGVRFWVTPADAGEDAPLKARTTSQFLKESGVQVAINGDGFHPWWSRGPLDYYPHAGDPVTPNGFSAARGEVYARGDELDTGKAPTLYISRGNDLSFNVEPGRVFHAISGDRMLVEKGQAVAGLDDTVLQPRTAVGINRNGRWIYLVVVDGRQPFYSQGASYAQLADILLSQGAYYAMALDGGGSSTLVAAGPDGEPQVLNSPIDQYIPGRERPVANHLGLFLEK